MKQAPDTEWVKRAQAKDQAAFAELVDRYWDRLRRWLNGQTRQAHLAEDLTQETFVRAWTALPSLQAGETFRVWLFRIARHCYLDSQRRSRVRKSQPLPQDLHGPEPPPLEKVIEQEAQKQLEEALARLPSHYRAAYLLWTQEDWPYSQIAQVLEISEETARWRVCKARNFLQLSLKKYLDLPKR